MAETSEPGISLAHCHIPAGKQQPPHGLSNLCQRWARLGFAAFPLQHRLPGLPPQVQGSCPPAGRFLALLGGKGTCILYPGSRDKDSGSPLSRCHSETSPMSLGNDTLPRGSCRSGSESRCRAGEGGTWAHQAPATARPLRPPTPPGAMPRWHGSESQSVPMEQHLPRLGDSPTPPTLLCAPVAAKALQSISQKLLSHSTASGREGAALGGQLLQRWRPCVWLHGGMQCEKICPPLLPQLGGSGAKGKLRARGEEGTCSRRSQMVQKPMGERLP